MIEFVCYIWSYLSAIKASSIMEYACMHASEEPMRKPRRTLAHDVIYWFNLMLFFYYLNFQNIGC